MVDKLIKSVLDQDNTAIVLCDLEHTIVYMNEAAVRNYANKGGRDLVGKSLLKCHNEKSCEMINQIIEWFGKSIDNNRVHTFYNPKQNKDGYMIALRDDNKKLIGYYEKHEFRTKDETPFYEMK